jgi:hypothetical protein
MEVLPAFAVPASLVQVLAIAVQVQGAAHEHDPAVHAISRATHPTDVFVLDVVGEGDRRLARVGPGFGADFQFPVQHDPLGGQLEVSGVGEAQFAVDAQTAQRRRTDVEDDFLARGNGDRVACGWHLAVRPGGRIGPVRRPGRRRSSFLGLNDSEYADEQEGWKERRKKERAMWLTHGINSPYLKYDQEPQRQSEGR